MLKMIPWNVIGPAAGAAIAILALVFWFILKMKKLEKGTPAPTNPPTDINIMSKKTVCFRHEGDIAANKKAVEMLGEHLKEASESNREAHGKIFKKLDELGEKIITEIHKTNEEK